MTSARAELRPQSSATCTTAAPSRKNAVEEHSPECGLCDSDDGDSMQLDINNCHHAEHKACGGRARAEGHYTILHCRQGDTTRFGEGRGIKPNDSKSIDQRGRSFKSRRSKKRPSTVRACTLTHESRSAELRTASLACDIEEMTA